MRFFHMCAAGALTLEVLSRGVNFATALKHDASKTSSTTELVRKETHVSKEKQIDDSFPVLKGHRALEAVDPEWETVAANLWSPDSICTSHKGLSMSADGKTFAVGCKEENQNSGRVKVFHDVDGEWKQKGEDIVGEESNAYLGNAVALSDDGNILAITIPLYPITTQKGCVRVYKYENDAWNLMGEQIEGEFDNEQFGRWRVVLSNDGLILAVSGGFVVLPYNWSNKDHGLVRVFRYANNQWEQLGDTFAGKAHNDNLGHGLSLSGNGKVMAIGIPQTDVGDSNTGSFRVYQYVNDAWVQMGDTMNAILRESHFGASIDISSDASTIVVGALGVGLGWQGYVMVFRFIENQWKQIGQTISATSTDGTGWAVHISSDGNIIAVPSRTDDENGENQGVVRVYEYSGTEWVQLGENIYGSVVVTSDEHFGYATALSASGYTLVAAGKTKGASVYKFPTAEEWDGVWFIDYDSVALSGNVLTSTYLTKPGVGSDFTVSHTVGACNTNGAPLVDSSVMTNVEFNATVVDDETSDTLSVAKTISAAAVVDDHDGELDFCETVTLTNTGEPGTETVNVVQAQAHYNVTASFLVEIGTYSSVTLQDDSSVTTVDEQSLSPEGTIAVERCGGLSDSINPGDKLCLEIYVSDSQSVGVDRIHNLDLKQGTSMFEAIDDGANQYTALVEESCVDGTCTVDIVVPESLFTDESGSGATTFTLSITGDAYLYEKGGAKDAESESQDFIYSVKLEKPCGGGLLRGFVENMLP